MTTTPNDVTSSATHDSGWTIADSASLYGLEAWGQGFFAATERGTLAVRPTQSADRQIDLYEIIRGLNQRGIHAPVLLRFSDLVRQRMGLIRGAFDRAIEASDYNNSYCCVYPIKVNQQRQVCEEIRDIAAELGFGLEVGSKPELLAALGMTAGGDTKAETLPIVCNGFKDDEYIETVVLAAKLGRRIITVVEQPRELRALIRFAEQYGVRPSIGIRVKPTSTGMGRWATSGGNRSKFGLSATDLLEAMSFLEEHKMLDCLNLLHFHIGSQIHEIRQVSTAVTELAHIYCECKRLGAGLTMIDVGGGLGVDYDGSGSPSDGSMNYGIEEYASSVVHRIKSVCDDAQIEHPQILSESGRAIAAFSSVLVVNVLGATTFDAPARIEDARKLAEESEETPQPIWDLIEAYESLDKPNANIIELFHDAEQARNEAMTLFGMGYVSLPQRATAERVFWAAGHKVLELAKAQGLSEREELARLPEKLSDIYYVNFSIFQSLPDHWAIDQVFPIAPIHRLAERPTRLAVLADMTCDSDGEIARFSDPGASGSKPRLELHELQSGGDSDHPEPYYLGVFLTGAYQEVLGDLHNLFGDTHAVHVGLDESGRWRIDEVVEGDTVREVLGYVQYDVDRLRRDMRKQIERAVHAGKLEVAEGHSLLRFYESGLEGYTYLE
ncbi:MAG: biosynthetic arginine decarboxylase [Phycisphaerales bacterium]